MEQNVLSYSTVQRLSEHVRGNAEVNTGARIGTSGIGSPCTGTSTFQYKLLLSINKPNGTVSAVPCYETQGQDRQKSERSHKNGN
jgi:hypothetical protein